MLQRVLAEPAWMARMTPADRRGLTPLVWGHVSPYGVFDLDMARPSVPTTVRHLPPGSLTLRVPKDHLAHAHAPHTNRCRGRRRHERRP
jgi:hypothetical protein